MDAGFGAEEQVTRRARRTERLRLQSEATGKTDSVVEAELERARRDQRNWAVGAEGERMIAQSLEALGRYGWTFLHDLRWPGRERANLDHVAIGPGGIVVIDAKNWSGEVTVANGMLRQKGYRRDSELEGVATATAAVTALLAPGHRTATTGILCLASQDQEPASTALGVNVVGRNQLTTYLVGLPHRLSPYDVAAIGGFLTSELGESSNRRKGSTLAPNRATVAGRARRASRSAWRGTPAVRHVPAQPKRAIARRPSAGRDHQDRSVGRKILRKLILLGIVLVVLANLETITTIAASEVSSLITQAVTKTPPVTPVVEVPVTP